MRTKRFLTLKILVYTEIWLGSLSCIFITFYANKTDCKKLPRYQILLIVCVYESEKKFAKASTCALWNINGRNRLDSLHGSSVLSGRNFICCFGVFDVMQKTWHRNFHNFDVFIPNCDGNMAILGSFIAHERWIFLI